MEPAALLAAIAMVCLAQPLPTPAGAWTGATWRAFRGIPPSGDASRGAPSREPSRKGGQAFPFSLKRAPAVAGPVLPAGLVEREIRVGKGPLALPGTLTLPAGKGPFPALVLVHGSGPLDRDERVGESTPLPGSGLETLCRAEPSLHGGGRGEHGGRIRQGRAACGYGGAG